jgi:hypothetical protein
MCSSRIILSSKPIEEFRFRRESAQSEVASQLLHLADQPVTFLEVACVVRFPDAFEQRLTRTIELTDAAKPRKWDRLRLVSSHDTPPNP